MSSPYASKPVVVTGASGYIGRHVVTTLADRGFEPVAVVRTAPDSQIDERARVVEADVLASDFDPRSVLDENTVAFIHLAWQDGFVHNAQSHLRNLSAHFALLSGVADAGAARVAVLGTMHEVGYWEGAITADTPTDPRSLYGVAKDALRRSTQIALADRTDLVWLRCFYIYGDDRRNNSIFTRVLQAVDDGKTSIPFTTGRNEYDFIHVADLAEQIVVAAVSSGVTGVINCCSGHPVSLGEQVERFIADHSLPIRLDYGAYPDRPYDSPAVWGDAGRINELMDAYAIAPRP